MTTTKPLNAAPAGELVELGELLSVAEFARAYPNLTPSEVAVRYYVARRHTNGLLACGAVVELRRDPNQRRARVLISPRRFLQWAQGKFGRGRPFIEGGGGGA